MSELLASVFDDAPVGYRAGPASAAAAIGAPIADEAAASEAEAAQPATRFDRILARTGRLFIWSCYASVVAILCWIAMMVTELVAPNSIESHLGNFDTIDNAALNIAFGVVAIGVPALTPFVSLAYMVLVVFKGLEIDRGEMWLSTFAVLTGALALVLSMTDEVCGGITEEAQTCFVYKWAFILDQFSKGSFGDIFDIFEVNFSPLDLEAMGALTRIYVLNFRMLSAVCLVAVTLALLGRMQDIREKRRPRRLAKAETKAAAMAKAGVKPLKSVTIPACPDGRHWHRQWRLTKSWTNGPTGRCGLDRPRHPRTFQGDR